MMFSIKVGNFSAKTQLSTGRLSVVLVEMFLQNRISIIYSLVICTLICSVVALKCDKLITTNDKATTEDRVFDEGIYRVKTTLPRDSAEIQELILSLKGISIIKHNKLSFTATLQPKHIKKVGFECTCCII